jgi:iron(III) transport system permease protein
MPALLRRHALSVALFVIAAVAVGLLLADSGTRPAAGSTLLLAAVTCSIALPAGTLLALLLARTDVPGRGLAAALLAVMLLVPLYLQAAGWEAGFGKLGWHAAATGRLAQPLLAGWQAAIWIHAMAAIPWVVLLVGLGVRLVEPELEDDALLAGGAAAVFLRLTLPRAATSLIVAGLWVGVMTAGEMTVTNIYMVPNYAELVYTGFALGESAYEVTLRTLPGMAIAVLCVLGGLVAVRHVAAAYDTSLRPARAFRLGGWRWPAAIAAWTMVLLLAGVPLANLGWQAGAETRAVEGQLVRGWSLAKFASMVAGSPGEFREEFGWTLLIAAAAAACAVALALPLAWMARHRDAAAWLVLLIAAVLLAVPGPLLGMAVNAARPLSSLTVRLYDDTIFAPVAALALRTFPLALLICWYALRTLADDVLEAAQTEGAGPLTRLLRVVAPQRVQALAAAWLAALAVAAGELAASILAVPPGVSTLSIRVFGMIHFGVTDQVAGVCLVSAAGYAALGAAVLALLGRRGVFAAWTSSGRGSDRRSRPTC